MRNILILCLLLLGCLRDNPDFNNSLTVQPPDGRFDLSEAKMDAPGADFGQLPVADMTRLPDLVHVSDMTENNDRCTPSNSPCASGLDCCPGVGCADFDTDFYNCGGCGNKCFQGQTCKNGSCSL